MSDDCAEQRYVKETFDTNWSPDVNGFEKDLEDAREETYTQAAVLLWRVLLPHWRFRIHLQSGYVLARWSVCLGR